MHGRKKKVLFVCVHNSARSVIAEAMLNQLCGDLYEAQSAGLRPVETTAVNPLAVAVLKQEGIDVSDYKPRHVFDVVKSGQMFSHVIAVCDAANAERCPIFPGVTLRLPWGFPDPAALEGSWDEKLAATRQIRDQIKDQIAQEFCVQNCPVA
jgi:arsenate reductase